MRTCLWIVLCGISVAGIAEDHIPIQDDFDNTASTVDYPASFFSRYRPNTALDMVRQVPGFQIDDGDNTRGFAGAAGNILINGRRPSAKQDRPSAILSRIPATQVTDIELFHGQTGGIDLRGQSTVINVILSEDGPAAIHWESSVLYSTAGPVQPGIKASLSDRWKNIEYNIGTDIERDANGEFGNEYIFNSDNELTEERNETQQETGINLGAYLNASSYLGDTLYSANGKFSLNNAPQILESRRFQAGGAFRENFIKEAQHNRTYEFGIDAERYVFDDLAGKMILLFMNKLSDVTSTQTSTAGTGTQILFRQADTVTETTEGIMRLELDWSGLPNHAIQLNLEGAYNRLDGSLFQIENTGSGTVIVDVPGGNTRVQESRGDFLLKDTWLHGNFELDYGLGAEISTISQSGDEERKRNFFFLVPQASLSYSLGQGAQTRLRIAREIAQLNFNDFISTTVFEDDDLALGNPDLRPDKTWIMELGYEKRFGDITAIKVTAFHHWISDVLDLLPLSPTFEVPGNIGNGRRWGLEMENTFPLGWIGLTGSRMDVRFRWQDSSVIDPVTGDNRVLSATAGFRAAPNIKFREGNSYVIDLSYRQDFESERLAWGWRAANQAERPVFKVNEKEIYSEDRLLFEMFIETSRWPGVKVRIEGHNLFNYREHRDRTTFTGQRNISPVESFSLRERTVGRRVKLVLTGSF